MKRNYSVFTMMSIKHLEEVQANQKEDLRELKIKTEVQLVKCLRSFKQSEKYKDFNFSIDPIPS